MRYRAKNVEICRAPVFYHNKVCHAIQISAYKISKSAQSMVFPPYPKNALGSNLSHCKRKRSETFHLVPPSVKKSGFKQFLHIHLSSAFTAFHQNKGHIKDTESSSSTAAVTRQRLFFINQVFKKLISTVTRRMAFA